MDDNLREIGIGDLKVPKEMRRMGEAFYGRAQAYRAALADSDDEALMTALARNIYGGAQHGAARRLAAYMREALRDLASQETVSLASGQVHFPDPAEFAGSRNYELRD